MFKIDVENVKKPKRFVSKVFLHCSASDNPKHDNIETITKWHLERGFSEVGYHFFIQKNGDIIKGRDLEKIPAAQKGHNTGSIAICCHGLNKFTEEQKASVRELCLHLNRIHNHGLTFHGHCEVEPNKTCPVYDYKAWLWLDKDGAMMVC